VHYAAPAPTAEEQPHPHGAPRTAAHQAARPAGWTTLETRDLAAAVTEAGTPVLVDCLGTWLTGVLDERGLWDYAMEDIRTVVDDLLDELVRALRGSTVDVVVVTNEVGLGVVPAHRSGMLFRDLLGTVNQRVAACCDEVHLVVAGRVLEL
jgi:adenosylcobinamide kinase/adenosylcobinamide-phosphate guanylyltransferase